jgi:leucyl/phenylalanyl-tRNA--protein transferase
MVRRVLPGRRPLFPPTEALRYDSDGLFGIGGDLCAETVLEAYEKGLFPWDGRKPYPWYSPDPRMVLVPGRFKASDSLRKLDRQGKLRVVYDQDFSAVLDGCAFTERPGQPGTWITAATRRAYGELFRRGVAHTVETRDAEGELVGGLYGVAVGRIFFGESMFARRRDASKIALYDLCRRLDRAGFHLIDCQAETDHLASIGAEPVPRPRYLELLAAAWSAPPAWADAMAVDPRDATSRALRPS